MTLKLFFRRGESWDKPCIQLLSNCLYLKLCNRFIHCIVHWARIKTKPSFSWRTLDFNFKIRRKHSVKSKSPLPSSPFDSLMACARCWEFKGQRGRLVVKCKLMKFSMSPAIYQNSKRKTSAMPSKLKLQLQRIGIPWRRKLLNQLICPCEQMWLGSPPPLGNWRLVILGAWRVGLLEEAIKWRWIIEHRALCLRQPQPASHTASHHTESWFFPSPACTMMPTLNMAARQELRPKGANGWPWEEQGFPCELGFFVLSNDLDTVVPSLRSEKNMTVYGSKANSETKE